MTESPGAASARTLRKHSLSGVGGYSEVWPETITGLLTGGQLLIDRSILFSRLAEELERNNSTSLEHDGNQKFNQREVCCPTMVKKTTGLRMRCGGVSIPRPDKTWGWVDKWEINWVQLFHYLSCYLFYGFVEVSPARYSRYAGCLTPDPYVPNGFRLTARLCCPIKTVMILQGRRCFFFFNRWISICGSRWWGWRMGGARL